jgi:hypothetical protein
MLADLLDDERLGAHLQQQSTDAIATGYAKWLAYLAEHQTETLLLSPAARATQARVIDYLHRLHGEISLRTLYNYGCRL